MPSRTLPLARKSRSGEAFASVIDVVAHAQALVRRYNEIVVGESGDWFWDPAWSFDCKCGGQSCTGRMDGYRAYPDSPLA